MVVVNILFRFIPVAQLVSQRTQLLATTRGKGSRCALRLPLHTTRRCATGSWREALWWWWDSEALRGEGRGEGARRASHRRETTHRGTTKGGLVGIVLLRVKIWRGAAHRVAHPAGRGWCCEHCVRPRLRHETVGVVGGQQALCGRTYPYTKRKTTTTSNE